MTKGAAAFQQCPVEADRQRQQLSVVLRDIGATPTTELTVLSDGAEGPRFLGETASPGPTRHVLDWFHLSMEFSTLHKQPEAGREGRKRISSTVICSRKRLTGSAGGYGTAAPRALDLIDEILKELEMPNRQIQLTAAYLKKLSASYAS